MTDYVIFISGHGQINPKQKNFIKKLDTKNELLFTSQIGCKISMSRMSVHNHIKHSPHLIITNITI